MGVDFDGVGGIGFKVEDHLEVLLQNEEFTTLWETDKDSAVELLCADSTVARYRLAGDCFDGKTWWYVKVKGTTLQEVLDNCPDFVYHFRTEWGLMLDFSKLKVIEDLCIW